MEYNQFRQLLQLKSIREKETVSQLEDFIERFPYCQTSRLLLAKALHDQDSIHYDRSLKLAAAYASSREVLRDLVEKRTEEIEYEFPLPKKESAGLSADASVFPPQTSGTKKAERFEEWFSEDEISGRAFIEQKEKEKLVDPHEVIRQRLNEILSVSDIPVQPKASEDADQKQTGNEIQPEAPAATSSPPDLPEVKRDLPEVKDEVSEPEKVEEAKPDKTPEASPVQKTPAGQDAESKIIAEAGQVRDVLDKMELEHAMEESILESLTQLPVIAPEKNFGEKISAPGSSLRRETVADQQTPRSFTDWLKSFQSGTSGYQEVHAPAPKPAPIPTVENLPEEVHDQEAHLSDDELIEKFLLDDPKIVPSKAEFYSPVNQAKKSVMDHDDVVSETLAGIYLRQGNTRKARWCYERLMLLHPEKSAFFAALLKEIDEQPNSKEDL